MPQTGRIFLITAAALLAGCPLENDDGAASHLGTWKLDGCGSGFGCSCSTPLACPDVIELAPDRFEEYRGGSLYRSGSATYFQAQCIIGEHLVLQVDGGPYWCLYVSDGEQLGACEDVFDGYCYHFRRCGLLGC